MTKSPQNFINLIAFRLAAAAGVPTAMPAEDGCGIFNHPASVGVHRVSSCKLAHIYLEIKEHISRYIYHLL
jgi:hypothetical protein